MSLLMGNAEGWQFYRIHLSKAYANTICNMPWCEVRPSAEWKTKTGFIAPPGYLALIHHEPAERFAGSTPGLAPCLYVASIAMTLDRLERKRYFAGKETVIPHSLSQRTHTRGKRNHNPGRGDGICFAVYGKFNRIFAG